MIISKKVRFLKSSSLPKATNERCFPTRLQILFWEIKNRFFYVLLSFFFTFVIAYRNSNSLLYLFVSSYKKISKESLTFIKNSGVQEGYDDVLPLSESFAPPVLLTPKVVPEAVLSALPKAQPLAQPLVNSVSTLSSRLSVDSLLETNEVSCKVSQDILFSFYENEISNAPLSILLYFHKLLESVDQSSISFIFTDVEEAFSSTIYICFIFSFVLVLPILIYQSFGFLSPSLHLFEKQRWLFRVFGVTLVWYLFISIVQTVLIPKLAIFLLQFQVVTSAFSVVGQTKIFSYCTWSISIFSISSLFFFLFSLLFFCVIDQKIALDNFTKRRQISRVIILLLSALIASPEIQFFLAFVALLLFESVLYFFCFYKHLLKKKLAL